jgi:hypothetical protein
MDKRNSKILKFESEYKIVQAGKKFFSNLKACIYRGKFLLDRLNTYLANFQTEINNSKILISNFLSEITTYNKHRVENGINQINKVLVNILNPEIKIETLKDVYSKIFKKRQIIKHISLSFIEKGIETSKIKNKLIKKSVFRLFPRAWSLWRIEDLILEIQDRVHIKGSSVMRACLNNRLARAQSGNFNCPPLVNRFY